MPDPVEVRLARATLIALRAVLPMPHEAFGWGYVLLPDTVPLDQEMIIDALVMAPKPVRCAALALDGALAVAVWPHPHQPRRAPDVTSEVEAHRRQVLEEHSAARLLFSVDGEEPIVLTPTEMFRWQDEYEVIGLGVTAVTGLSSCAGRQHWPVTSIRRRASLGS